MSVDSQKSMSINNSFEALEICKSGLVPAKFEASLSDRFAKGVFQFLELKA